MKAEKRKAERKWQRTHDDDDKKAFNELRTILTNHIRECKKSYIQDKIKNAPQTQKGLFGCMQDLIYKPKGKALPTNIPVEDLPDIICEFFVTKIRKIQSKLNSDDQQLDSEVDTSNPVNELFAFDTATEEEIEKIIKASPTKSCALDAIPTFLLKQCLDVLLPCLTTIVNQSLSSASVPVALKQAMVTPLLKKPSADPDVLSNNRPVSNLPFISKVLEKVVSARLSIHKKENNLYENFQSAYRSGHSTETALLRVQNDILRAIDSGKCVFLVLLDLSAAFDTVTHDVMLDRLKSRFGITGDAQRWIASYLKERSQSVCISGKKSSSVPLTCGVPQGSVLGPDLFSDYSSPVASIIQSSKISVHCYADDTQLYHTFEPGKNEEVVLHKLETCIEKLRSWMRKNKLKLNDDKTKFVVFGTPSALKEVKTSSIQIGDHVTQLSSCVRNIGAYFDSILKMNDQVQHVCKSAWYHLHQIRKLQGYLTEDQLKTLIHAYVTSKLDTNNGLLCGAHKYQTAKLQLVQNAAAKVICGLRKFDRVTPSLYNLHWLPIEQRIIFKILLLVYKARSGEGPKYLKDLLLPYSAHHKGLTVQLRSSDDPTLLDTPSTDKITYGDRSFSYAGTYYWNKLPQVIRELDTLPRFKKELKTHLFEKSY